MRRHTCKTVNFTALYPQISLPICKSPSLRNFHQGLLPFCSPGSCVLLNNKRIRYTNTQNPHHVGMFIFLQQWQNQSRHAIIAPGGSCPTCLQMTSTSSSLISSVHTVPQALLIHISTLPSRSLEPLTRRTSP